MSRAIRLNIDRVVLRGIDPADQHAFVRSLRSELTRILVDPATQAGMARSRRTPVIKVAGLAFEPGLAGASHLGTNVARAIGRGLKS